MTLGIVTKNLSPNSFLRHVREEISLPLIATTNYFSSATSGGAAGSMSIAASASGDAVLLSAAAAMPVRYGRLPTITLTDAAFGSAIVLTVRITGKRFGKTVVQDITATSVDTNPLTVAGTRVLDEVTSAKIVSVTNNTTSDTLQLGFDGTRLGLAHEVSTVKALRLVEKIVSGATNANGQATAGAAGAVSSNGTLRAGSVVKSSSVLFTADSSIDVNALYATTVASTDRYIVEYYAGGASDEYRFSGKYALG